MQKKNRTSRILRLRQQFVDATLSERLFGKIASKHLVILRKFSESWYNKVH